MYDPNPPRPNPERPRWLRGRDGGSEADDGDCASLHGFGLSTADANRLHEKLERADALTGGPDYLNGFGRAAFDPN